MYRHLTQRAYWWHDNTNTHKTSKVLITFSCWYWQHTGTSVISVRQQHPPTSHQFPASWWRVVLPSTGMLCHSSVILWHVVHVLLCHSLPNIIPTIQWLLFENAIVLFCSLVVINNHKMKSECGRVTVCSYNERGHFSLMHEPLLLHCELHKQVRYFNSSQLNTTHL